MSKLTKRKTLTMCKELWTWLVANPLRPKRSWPGFAEHGYMASDCPCCQYVTDRIGSTSDCTLCPLEGIAWKHDSHDSGSSTCIADGSPYAKWSDAYYNSDLDKRTKLHIKYAKQMVKHCNTALRRLPPLKKRVSKSK